MQGRTSLVSKSCFCSPCCFVQDRGDRMGQSRSVALHLLKASLEATAMATDNMELQFAAV